MTNTIVLELLRGRALLVNVVSVAFPEGLIHLPARHVDGVDGRVVQAPTMAGILEHGERLTAMVNEHPFASQFVQGERRIRRARSEKESVLLVDLGEVHGRRPLAFLQGAESLRGRRLTDVYRSLHQPLDGRSTGRGDRVHRLEPFLFEEAAGNGGDQRRIEGGKARELDADRITH